MPLFAGVASWWVGLPHLPVDWATVVFLFLGCWGAVVGVFSGMLMAGLSWRRALSWLAWSSLLGPLAVAVTTVVVAMPIWAVLQLRGGSGAAVGFTVMMCWFLISAAAGVEVLDRAVRRGRRRRWSDDQT